MVDDVVEATDELNLTKILQQSSINQEDVRDCGFVQLDRPAHSHDLILGDYYVF